VTDKPAADKPPGDTKTDADKPAADKPDADIKTDKPDPDKGDSDKGDSDKGDDTKMMASEEKEPASDKAGDTSEGDGAQARWFSGNMGGRAHRSQAVM
jgi:hypothetical protein